MGYLFNTVYTLLQITFQEDIKLIINELTKINYNKTNPSK